MDTLVVEKALQDVRGLQGELAAFGVDDAIELIQPSFDSCVAVICRKFDEVEFDERDDDCIRILPNGRFHVGWGEPDGVPFDRFRLLTIDAFIRHYERKSGVIGSKWKELCDGEDEPLPGFPQVRMEKLGDVADRLRGLVRGED